MGLDFTGLDSLAAEKQPTKTPQDGSLGQGEYKTTSCQDNAAEGRTAATGGTAILQREADNKRDALATAAAVYKRYQENIKATEILQAEILKGVAAGEDLQELFLKAVKALSLTISNDLFYNQIAATLQGKGN